MKISLERYNKPFELSSVLFRKICSYMDTTFVTCVYNDKNYTSFAEFIYQYICYDGNFEKFLKNNFDITVKVNSRLGILPKNLEEWQLYRY